MQYFKCSPFRTWLGFNTIHLDLKIMVQPWCTTHPAALFERAWVLGPAKILLQVSQWNGSHVVLISWVLQLPFRQIKWEVPLKSCSLVSSEKSNQGPLRWSTVSGTSHGYGSRISVLSIWVINGRQLHWHYLSLNISISIDCRHLRVSLDLLGRENISTVFS